MKVYEFKFSLGDKVFRVLHQYKNSYVDCDDCQGEKIVLPSGKEMICPKCGGKGCINNGQVMYYTPQKYSMTIGEQRVEINDEKVEESYMCRETGIGSGTVYIADKLFSSMEEAGKEAGRLNGENGDEYYCEKCKPAMTYHKDYGYSKYSDCTIHGHERFWASEETKVKLRIKWDKEQSSNNEGMEL